MPTSKKDVEHQATNKPPNHTAIPTTASTASGSIAPVASLAEAGAAKESSKQIDVPGELGAIGGEINVNQHLIQEQPYVINSPSTTPLRTRSGITRQPIKRARVTAKPCKNKLTDEEHRISLLPTFTSIATSHTSTPAITEFQLPTTIVTQSENIAAHMSALSLQRSTNVNYANTQVPNIQTHTVYSSNAVSSAVMNLQQQLLAENYSANNNQHAFAAPSTIAFKTKPTYTNQEKGNFDNTIRPSQLNNILDADPYQSTLNASAPIFTNPISQSSNILSSSFFPSAPNRSSAPFTSYDDSFVRRASQPHNPSAFQYNNSHPSFFVPNNSIPALTFQNSNINNLTADVTLSTSQIASRQAISKDLPIFSGNPEEWPIFITNYEQSTERCGFTLQENLIRLQKCLKGRALEAVKGKLMTPATVSFAIDTLRMLYGRPEVIHHTLQKRLKEQPPVRKENLDGLIHLALSVQNYRTTMQAMGLADYLNDPLLLDDLVQKLPCDLKLDWGRHRCKISKVDITVFDSWLYELAMCASHVTTCMSTSQFESKKSVKERINVHKIVENDTKYDNITTISCFKCNKCHRLADCPEFLLLTINERWNLIREHNLCLRCFKRHSLRRCHSKKRCEVDNCKMPHNPLLHTQSNSQNLVSKNKSEPQHKRINSSILFHGKSNKALFRYVPVTLFGKTHSLNTFALIDEGSSCTLIEDELALELGLDGPKEKLCLQWTGDITQTDQNSKIISLQISSREHPANKMTLHNVRTIARLNLPIQSLTQNDIDMHENLRHLSILPYTSVKARILIGIDNAKLCVPLESKESSNEGLIAVKCRLGWSVYGRQPAGDAAVNRILHVCSCGMYERVDELLQNYFSLDSIGIKQNINPLRSKEDEYASVIMESTTKFIPTENVWETGLLWKYKNICLPDSFSMARRRLFCLEAKMKKDSLLKEFLVDKMRDYERKGYIRKLQANEISSGGKSWYIPIFTVKNKNKNKTRIVWDAAAAVNNVSLNSVLLKGPDLLKSLLGVLFRFRERPVALTGDIREMFHQIRIAKHDQCAQQFLWREGNTSKDIDVYVMTVMTFGASCSPSLANFVKNKNAERFSEIFPEVVSAILNNTFVDDWLQSMDSEAEMSLMAKRVHKIHEEGGFEMRNWLSNSKYVLNSLKCSVVDDKKDFKGTEDNCEKVLGMWWMPSTDELIFSKAFCAGVFDESVLPTKRNVLRIIMSIFDPLGLIGHFIICAKIILQEIWRSKVKWDEPLYEQERSKWWMWLKVASNITNIRIPRCHQYLSCSSNVQLHTFVDASIDAYAAVAYVRVEHSGNVNCSLVASKTRVAPLKPISIPKLELMAAILGLRLANFITNEMTVKVSRKIFWSDSKDVLYWIKSDARKFQQFVSLRIGEILEGSQVKQWRWVPSAQNVADDGTKWNNLSKINSDSRWFYGPSFLKLDENEWPKSEFTTFSDSCVERLCYIKSKKFTFNRLELIPDPNRFSKWEKFRASQMFVLKFIRLVMGARIKDTKLEPFICKSGIEIIELFIFRVCQEQSFYEEINALKFNKCVPSNSILHRCSPYLDELGVLRMKGRIDAILNVPLNTKRPIIIPPKHRITYLLIDFYHRKYHHQHNEVVVNEIRQKFWITGLRAAVRATVKTCQLCKNRRAIPSAPKMGDLPIERLSAYTTPFHVTGVDYFGPIDIVIGRRKEKRWCVLFTCLTVRAVHIEVAPSLSTDSFLMVFKQFTSRRGVPCRIISDNATNFRGASRILREEVEKISPSAVKQRIPEIEWSFIPPSSPHMGGAWERMVRSAKSILMDILPESGLREEVLRAALADVESILNSRPLTYVPLDSSESEALTPNHFLIGSTSGIRERVQADCSGAALSKNFRISSLLADRFWKRWVKEVVPHLARRTKWYTNSPKPIEINDVVIIADENTKRNTWVKGIVIDVHRGKDNIVRSAVVKTAKGLLTRPVVKLAKLDVKG